MATGPFAYRIGGMLAADDLHHFHITSSKHIGQLLSHRHPAAILVGFEDKLDTALEGFAIENGFKLYKNVIPGGRLYIQPSVSNG